MRNTQSRILIILLFSCIACKKHKQPEADNPYGLPNATEEGKRTFACRINGQNFVAFNDNDHLAATLNSDTLIIGGRPKSSSFQTILLQLNAKIIEGNAYAMNKATGEGKYFSDSLCTGLLGNIYSFDALSGSIQVTKFDPLHKILSGEFNLLIPVANCDTLNITDGRFDVRYN